MDNKIKTMIKNDIIKKVNHVIKDQGFLLIDPPSAMQESGTEKLLWVANQSGEIIAQDVNILDLADGFNLLKDDASFGFNDYVANLCDAVLIKAGIRLTEYEEDMLKTTDL